MVPRGGGYQSPLPILSSELRAHQGTSNFVRVGGIASSIGDAYAILRWGRKVELYVMRSDEINENLGETRVPAGPLKVKTNGFFRDLGRRGHQGVGMIA